MPARTFLLQRHALTDPFDQEEDQNAMRPLKRCQGDPDKWDKPPD
jgi:hypothetical protein